MYSHLMNSHYFVIFNAIACCLIYSQQAYAKTAWDSPLHRQCLFTNQTTKFRLLRQQNDFDKRVRKVLIDPSNFSSRKSFDIQGNPLIKRPNLIVLHETVYGIQSVITTFKTYHPNDFDQGSYHVAIDENGNLFEFLPDHLRAFGAGNSSFNTESVQTSKNIPPSVNNFSLHVSLESPIDGEDADEAHSGYSEAQYDSLAILLSRWMKKYSIPFHRITTHKFIDRSGERLDPRSFDWSKLQERLAGIGALCR